MKGRARLVLRSVTPFLAALPVLWLLQGALPSYYSFVFINIAVNVILAVSLNVVNGFTGQFSIGHAAFMAVGAYTAALVTTGMEAFQVAGLPPVASDAVVFFVALVAGRRRVIIVITSDIWLQFPQKTRCTFNRSRRVPIFTA
ncbi:MAG: hypothetical protein WCS72_12605 [Deltaproteobacteria bacterium]